MDNGLLFGSHEDKLIDSVERVATAVQQLTDRQRVTVSATSSIWHGLLPKTLEPGYVTPSTLSTSVCEMRFVNLGDTAAQLEVYLINWGQITKSSGDTYKADSTIPETAVASDIILRKTLAPKGDPDGKDQYFERCCFAVPERWQLRLQAEGEVCGHISGIELSTV